MRYVRIYADDAGETHFEQVSMELSESDYRPPAPVMFVSHAYEADALQFVKLPAGWVGNGRPASSLDKNIRGEHRHHAEFASQPRRQGVPQL